MCRAGLVLLDFIFGCRVSSGHPSHCRPNLVLLDLFLLSPLQVVTHLSSDLSWCFWTSCSAIPFPAVTHPTADRARCCLTVFFDCLLFRRSSIQVPTRHGAAGLHLRLSRFPGITHPTADRARCCLTFFFECLLFRWSPIQVPTWHGAAGLHLRLSRFPAITHPTADRARCCLTFSFDCLFLRPSPIHVPSWPGAAGLHLRLSRFQRSPIPLPTEPDAA